MSQETLKDLQNRLTHQQAAPGESAVWLGIQAGAHKYLFPLSQSGEVFSCPDVQPVPYTQPWFLGVAHLRGAVYGVVDFASFVANQAPPSDSLPALGTAVKLVTFHPNLDMNCALCVSSITGLRKPDEFTPSPALVQATEFFGRTLIDAQGSTWQEINLQTLVEHARFLAIGSRAC